MYPNVLTSQFCRRRSGSQQGFGNIIFIRRLMAASLTLLATAISAQQIADPDFDASVPFPTYTEHSPKVLFDEAHNNFHTAKGRYKPFVDLIRSDGYRIEANLLQFTNESLSDVSLVVIASASGPNESPTESPFSIAECDAISAWVLAGGNLLLITDHAPHGKAARELARRFNIEMRGTWTLDSNHHESTGNKGWLIFSRQNGLLRQHPIIAGRNQAETIGKVTSFMGQSMLGPANSTAFLTLSETAIDEDMDGEEILSAAGRAQGIALQYGKGRVVALGEAAMLTAQYVDYPDEKPFRTGMGFPGSDNRQLALNIVHWLTGVLP